MRELNTLRRFALLCVLAGVWASCVCGDTPSFPDNPRFAVQRLADQFGLSAVTVTAMGQDRQGFLWIGTQTGLYRYDGARAQKMNEVEEMIGHYVLDLVIAPDGTPWFAGNRGIAHYKNSRFESLAIPPSAMPLGSGTQIFAVDAKGIVFVLLFNHGLLRVDPENPSQCKLLADAAGIDETVSGIARADDDSIWFTYGTHLAHFDAGSDKVDVDEWIKIPHERVVALVWDGTQTLWLRTATKLERLDPRAHRVIPEKIAIGPVDEEEGKPSLDQQGQLLVPSSNGLYWQGADGKWQVITDKQGITSNDIQFALEDREGTLWIAGSGTGLDRVAGVHEWSGWTKAEGLLDNNTWATARDRSGRLWVTTARGIAVWDGRQHQWRQFPPFGEKSQSQVRQLQVAGDGSIWGTTVPGALVRIDATNFTATIYAGYHGRTFQNVSVSPRGEVWATTRDHLVRFDPRNPSAVPRDLPVPLDAGEDLFFVTFSPEGTLWVSGRSSVYRYDGRSWETIKGLPGQSITSLLPVTEKEAWVAFNDVVNVTRIVLDDSGKVRFENHSWDWAIVGRDPKGSVWFNGPDGLALLSAKGNLQRLSHADGLIWNDVSPWSGVREEKDGSYLIATSKGLARYKPQEGATKAKRANVVFTNVNLGGETRRMGDVPRVRSAEGSLLVQFTPMILDNPERAACWYQLKGLEKQFTETEQREVHYGGLPAGDYELVVQCGGPGVMAAATPATFRFQVLPNLWQTWWARVAGVLVLLVCFWAYVRQRTNTLNRRQLELEKAVAQRNAELIEKNKALEDISLTDPLTETRNRRYFYETISTDIAQAVRSHLGNGDEGKPPKPEQELIFALVDIDRFKRVNDEMGHPAGDRLLKEVAKRIASVMRRSDDLVRWGGEEFLLVCRTTDRENASLMCNRVLGAIRDLPFDVGNGVEIHKTCSIGWAPFPWLKEDVSLLSIENVIELADKALYLAKREGRNRSYGLLPAPDVYRSEKSVSIQNLRDCPPDLVQIV